MLKYYLQRPPLFWRKIVNSGINSTRPSSAFIYLCLLRIPFTPSIISNFDFFRITARTIKISLYSSQRRIGPIFLFFLRQHFFACSGVIRHTICQPLFKMVRAIFLTLGNAFFSMFLIIFTITGQTLLMMFLARCTVGCQAFLTLCRIPLALIHFLFFTMSGIVSRLFRHQAGTIGEIICSLPCLNFFCVCFSVCFSLCSYLLAICSIVSLVIRTSCLRIFPTQAQPPCIESDSIRRGVHSNQYGGWLSGRHPSCTPLSIAYVVLWAKGQCYASE